MAEYNCKMCWLYKSCEVPYKGKFTCRCFGANKSDVLLENIILHASHGDDGCAVERSELEAFREAVREETRAEMELKLGAQENSTKSVLEAIFNAGHDDDCLFCGRKDGIVLRAAEQWDVPLKIDVGQ